MCIYPKQVYDKHGQYEVIFTHRKNVDFVPEIRTIQLIVIISAQHLV